MRRQSFAAAVVVCLFVGLVRSVAAAPPAGAAPGPHAGQPVLLSEHRAMLDLVRPGDATHVAAAAGGRWSDPATWDGRRVPAAGAVVLIPAGTAVTYDVAGGPDLRAVRVDGRLDFDTGRDTRLSADTILVAPGAGLTIGTPDRPVRRGHAATIVFADAGPLDAGRDPARLGRGLISHGTVSIHGDPVTPFVSLARPARRGDTTLHLAAEPKNWAVGDRLVLPATTLAERQDEELTVLAVAGREVTVGPLEQDHVPPADDLSVPVANLTRTVRFTSANPAPDRAGHVMFMHAPSAQVAYAAFDHLGRTDKGKRIDDPRVDDAGGLVAGSGSNPRGRYPVHFHRTGVGPGADAPQVVGCVVADSPGWGFVNHSSRVDFRDCVSYRVFGSGFVTEAGDEAGSFVHNLAVRSAGSGEGEDDRRNVQDFGHEGDGFWFQGPGVAVRDNVACGQAATGFIFFTQGLRQDGLGMARFPAANFADPAWRGRINPVWHKDPDRVNDPDSAPVILVPITGFRDNVAFACDTGITVRFHTGSPDVAPSVIERSTIWNARHGAKVRYTSHLVLRDLRLVGGGGKGAMTGVSGTLEGDQDIRYENLDVRGWACGIAVPEAGTHTIVGGTWANARSIQVPTPYGRGRRVFITGDVRFADAPAASLGGGEQVDIDLAAVFGPLISGYGARDPNVLFAPDPVRIDTPAMKGQLYYAEQAADHVPFPTEAPPDVKKRMGDPAAVLPADLIGRSNRELSERFGLALAGALPPADARRLPRVNGLLGTAATYPPERFPAELRSADLHGYRLTLDSQANRVKPVKGTAVATTVGDPADLRPGWNLLCRTIDGRPASFLVFGSSGRTSAGERKK